MSNYNWCHGPNCHTSHTQDRIRGVKGSKVLRTRKIKSFNNPENENIWHYFCSQGCYTNFFYKYFRECIAIAPRLEALETPIEVVKEQARDWSGRDYMETKIIAVDTNGG
jgi:hypothetical protein